MVLFKLTGQTLSFQQIMLLCIAGASENPNQQ